MNKQATFEFKRLRSALAIWVLLSAGTGYFCYESHNYLQAQIAEEEMILGQIRDVQQREKIDFEHRRVNDEYAATFKRMDKKGLFAQSKKLDWVEIIEMAARQLRIPLTKYELSTSEKKPLPVSVRADQLGLYKTPLNLSLVMLHEGDLLAMENYLRSQNLGLFSFESCELRRTRDKPSFQRLEAMMSAECQLSLYNFKFNDQSTAAMTMDPGIPPPEV